MWLVAVAPLPDPGAEYIFMALHKSLNIEYEAVDGCAQFPVPELTTVTTHSPS
jgi:hypothetical protein